MEIGFVPDNPATQRIMNDVAQALVLLSAKGMQYNQPANPLWNQTLSNQILLGLLTNTACKFVCLFVCFFGSACFKRKTVRAFILVFFFVAIVCVCVCVCVFVCVFFKVC
jgi:hypothetical protein